MGFFSRLFRSQTPSGREETPPKAHPLSGRFDDETDSISKVAVDRSLQSLRQQHGSETDENIQTTVSPASIRIVDVYPLHRKIAAGLDIRSSSFPLTVGCSIRSDHGHIIDIPSRTLGSQGLALWEIEAPSECARCDAGDSRPFEWGGDVLFALWQDTSYSKRLADTGWVKWAAPWLLGHSPAGLVYLEQEIQRKYGARKGAWGEDDAALLP